MSPSISNKYLMLSAGQFISGDGRCQSFGEGGEWLYSRRRCRAVCLKRLSQAERDGDVIHGVIRASTLNHGGKTNGLHRSQSAGPGGGGAPGLKEAGVDPRHISYVEAHGTGTKLGDPIEIAGLTKPLRKDRRYRLLLHRFGQIQYRPCGIGRRALPAHENPAADEARAKSCPRCIRRC